MTEDNKLVYVAGPYSKGVWEENMKAVIEEAEKLFNNGYTPFIPHTMTSVWALLYPKEKEKWLEVDLTILSRCDALVRVKGESEGADIEVGYCEDNNIPVYNSAWELIDDGTQ